MRGPSTAPTPVRALERPLARCDRDWGKIGTKVIGIFRGPPLGAPSLQACICGGGGFRGPFRLVCFMANNGSVRGFP